MSTRFIIKSMGTTTEQKKGEEKKKSPKPAPKVEYNDYLIFLHKKPVELHINYGGSILKLQGILRAKARYDVQLILDEKKKEIITINKAYIVMVKPL